MPTATTTAYVDSALALLAKSETTYLALGKKTPWENESIPPMAEEDITDIQEIIGFKKMDTVSLCRPLGAGETTNYPTITYKGSNWVLIPKEKAHEEGAYHLYFATTVTGTELPTGTYRQVGVYTELKTSAQKKALLPGEVTSRGKLQFYDNRQQFNRTDRITVTERFVVSMKGV